MEIKQNAQLNEIVLKGDAFERGVQHGLLLGNAIRVFLDDDLAQINKLTAKSLDKDRLKKYVAPYREIIRAELPGIMLELEGLAQGAEISPDAAVLLQIRRELLGICSFTLTGDCSSFGSHLAGRVVLGQTIDLNGDMTSLGQVFRIIPSEPGMPEILMYSFAGLLGYMGMNSFGLAVTINLVVSHGWREGIPPYLIVRRFLECSSIEECIQAVKTLTCASSRSFIISDPKRQIILELTPDDHRILEGEFLVHTNHFLHPDFKSIDRMNIFSRNSSVKRFQLLQKELKDDAMQPDKIQSVFGGHSLYPVGICAHNMSNLKWMETVAAVIMYPREGVFLALKGKPCSQEYKVFNLHIH